MSRSILVSGASGLIGTELVSFLRARGDRVVALVRRPTQTDDEIRWDPAAGDLPAGTVDGFDVVVNLSGAGVGDKRWSKRRKQLILDSRVDTTSLLAGAIAASSNPPSTFLSISVVGIYGQDRGDELLDESAGFGKDFLAQVAVQWEQAAEPAAAATRVVSLRTGMVLSNTGPLMAKFLPLFKAGLGGKLGSGRQWMSWISIDDEVAAIAHLMDSSLSGPVNLAAPYPVTNAEFTKVLARVLRRPALFIIPRFALVIRLGQEMADGMALSSFRVRSDRLIADGFEFSHPDLEPALRHVLGR